MSKRLTGINPLSYTGVEALTPPDFVIHGRAPTSNDWKNFNLGTFWLHREGRDEDPDKVRDLWLLVSLEGNVGQSEVATWIKFSFGDAAVTHFTADDAGIATPVADNINVFGGELINTEAAGSTIEINLDRANNGQVPIGANGLPTVFANLTAGTGIAIANGANAITISATGAAGASVGFLAKLETQLDAVTGDGTEVFLGAVTVPLIELYDSTNSFTPGNGAGTPATFTAPSDGLYLLEIAIEFTNMNSSTNSDVGYMRINTTNRTYETLYSPVGALPDPNGGFYMCALADMSEGDTATFSAISGNGDPTIGIGADNTYVAGALLAAASAAPLLVHTDDGDAVEMMGEINIFGDDPTPDLITTTGDGVETIRIKMVEGLDGQIPIAATGGPTLYSTITDGPLIDVVNSPNGIRVGLEQGMDGQIPIASTGMDTIYANITSLDASVTITNGNNSIDLSSSVPGYATGTFVPQLTFGGSTTGINYVVDGQYGLYTRIGNTVFVFAVLRLSNKGAFAAGALAEVKGFPYNIFNSGNANKTPDLPLQALRSITPAAGYTASHVHILTASAGTSSGSINAIGSGLAVQGMQYSQFANDSWFKIEGFYVTDDPF